MLILIICIFHRGGNQGSKGVLPERSDIPSVIWLVLWSWDSNPDLSGATFFAFPPMPSYIVILAELLNLSAFEFWYL